MPSPAADERNWLRKEVEDYWPALSFYYGIGFIELLKMPRWIRRAYAERLDELLAEVELASARAAVFPHLKQTDARKYVDALRRRLHAPESDPKKRPSVEALKGMGIKVVKAVVSKKRKPK